MRYLLVLIASVWLAGAASAQELSQEKFRDAYIARLLAMEPAATVTPDPNDVAKLGVTRPGEDDVILTFLDNPYRDYLVAPEDMMEIIDRHLRVTLGRSLDFSTALTADRLVVLARPAQMMRRPPTEEVVHQRFAGDLVEVLVIDGQDTIAYASNATLEELGLDRDAAFALARQNLLARVGPVDELVESGITVTSAESSLATGLLFAPGFCSAEQEDRLVFVPDRNGFWWAPASNASAAQRLRRVASSMARAGESMSRTVLECRSGAWR